MGSGVFLLETAGCLGSTFPKRKFSVKLPVLVDQNSAPGVYPQYAIYYYFIKISEMSIYTCL